MILQEMVKHKTEKKPTATFICLLLNSFAQNQTIYLKFACQENRLFNKKYTGYLFLQLLTQRIQPIKLALCVYLRLR